MIEIKRFQGLIDDAILIRKEVFVDEQHFFDEFDDIDQFATHLIAYEGEKPIAVARVFYDEKEERFKIGRFAVRIPYRNKGIGLMMVEEACKVVRERGAKEIFLHAQIQAVPFYEKAGFKTFGELEYEENYPHMWMKKSVL